MIKKHYDYLVTIALMIKNESASIEATLYSLLNGGFQYFFVLDTGSTDNTLALVQEFFRKHRNIVGYINQESFVDFASSRNQTLELAAHYFPDTTFFLMPDAEWYLHHADALLTFCEQEKHRDTPLYLIKIKMNSIEFATARLFRASQCIRFQGVVHEVPKTIATITTPDPIYFEVKASHDGIEKSQLRWKRDLSLLKKSYNENPNDPRITFYLAQTYECLGMFKEAYQFYQLRSKLNGWDEENFITLLRLGCLAERNNINNLNNWALAMDYFLQAFSLRPHRIEPLVKIAEHYWPLNIQTCFLFINYAYDIPYPKMDLLFIEKEMYDYHRYEIMSRCAWYMGRYELGEKATLLALKIHPHEEHLLVNLKLYREKLKLLVNIPSVI